jgi:hypothetical protein
MKTLKIFRLFSNANRGSRLPFKNIQENVALKRSPFTLANIFDSLCVTDSYSFLHLPFVNVFDPQSGTAISILKCSDFSCVYMRHSFSVFSHRF